jgi:putative ABC transport system permease protein
MNGYPYVILGTFTDGGSLSNLSSEVLVPDIALRRDFGPVPIRSVYVTANSVDDVGFVAEWTPLRLRPSRPNDIEVTRVGNDTTLAQAVDAELAQLSLIVVVVTTVLAAAIVAAVLTTSVVERRHEIGLRRALGATTRNIASMFASEGLLLGAAGSGFALVITAIAVLGVEFIWSVNFDIHPWFPWLVLAQGPVVGALGAIAPAVRASRLDPVDALGDR